MDKINNYKLIHDLTKLSKDFNELISDKKCLNSHAKIKKFADDIKKLNEELYLHRFEKTASLIYHMLSTPFGAPFVTKKTLLEASLNFENQSFQKSDLKHIFSDLNRYEKYFNSEISKIFQSLLKELKN